MEHSEVSQLSTKKKKKKLAKERMRTDWKAVNQTISVPHGSGNNSYSHQPKYRELLILGTLGSIFRRVVLQ